MDIEFYLYNKTVFLREMFSPHLKYLGKKEFLMHALKIYANYCFNSMFI